jgi:hypothetical protein
MPFYEQSTTVEEAQSLSKILKIAVMTQIIAALLMVIVIAFR